MPFVKLVTLRSYRVLHQGRNRKWVAGRVFAVIVWEPDGAWVEYGEEVNVWKTREVKQGACEMLI